MDKEELIIKTYLRMQITKRKKIPEEQKNDEYFEQYMIPFYKRVHTFI